MKSKPNAFSFILCASAVLALVGMIIYVISGTTGYLAGSELSAPCIVMPLILTLCAVVFFMKPDAFKSESATGLATFVLAVLMAFATVFAVVSRLDVIADMLNPVNHPDSEVTAVTLSIVGIVLFFVSFILAVVTTMGGELKKSK